MPKKANNKYCENNGIKSYKFHLKDFTVKKHLTLTMEFILASTFLRTFNSAVLISTKACPEITGEIQ